MLKKILSPNDCANCRFCCSFRRCSIWETPIFTEENIAAMVENEKNISCLNTFTKDDSTYATYDLSHSYKTDDSEEEVPCPFLDSQKGCTLNENEKPWDCRIWPLRVVNDESGNLTVALTPTCPSINKLELSEVTSFVSEELYDSLIAYAKEHPALIKDNPSLLPLPCSSSLPRKDAHQQ